MTTAAKASRKSRRKTLSAKRFRPALWRQFILFTLIPTFIAIVGLGWVAWHVPPSGFDMAVLLIMWALTGGLGISVGFHRLLTHRSFETYPALETAFAVLGSMAANGPVIYWVTVHRRHHQHSDQPHDPHSPCDHHGHCHSLRGLWRAHIGWTFDGEIPNPNAYAKDLAKKPWLGWVNRHYMAIVTAGLFLPAAICFAITLRPSALLSGFFYGGILRLVIGNHLIWGVNSLCHAFGYRSHQTRDSSTNNWLLAIPTFGEAWHNNHHAMPFSARFGQRWWELATDSGYWCICMMRCTRLAWDVSAPHSTKN